MKNKLERLEIIQEEWIMKKERSNVELKLATKMQLGGQPMTIKIQQSKMEISVCDSFIEFMIDLIVEEKEKEDKELIKNAGVLTGDYNVFEYETLRVECIRREIVVVFEDNAFLNPNEKKIEDRKSMIKRLFEDDKEVAKKNK